MPNSEDTQYVQCPYEASHRILKCRFQVHLGRCRKNYKDVPKSTCPFNVTHILNKPELDWHVSNCPDRASFENYKYRDEPTTRIATTPPPAPVASATVPADGLHVIESDENWDNEPEVPAYNPQKYVANAPVLRMMKGNSKAVKKQFRAQERLRLLGIDN